MRDLFYSDFGKEKQQALSGEYLPFYPTRTAVTNCLIGLSDSQIEERITTLVKESS